MKRACLLTMLVVPWVAHAESTPEVMIVEILPDPGAEREFIELWTEVGVDLDGWRIEDLAGNTFDLTGNAIPAGGRLVVWGGGEPTPEGPAWNKASVWNNGGDTAYLYREESLVDSFSYGIGEGPDAPATGESLAWDGAAWIAGDPTPGNGPQATATVTVQDVPPDVAFGALPETVGPGEAVTVSWSVHDGNGDAGITAWRLSSDGAVVAEGDAAGDFDETFTAPEAGTWRLRLEADDGIQTASIEASVQVQADGLRVVIPPGGLRFPDIAPGATLVEASGHFTVHNDGASAVTASIDIADFTGPDPFPATDLTLIVEGFEVAYTGPFTSLGTIAAGDSIDVMMRIDAVPSPLAAGTYGTSFAVVA